MFRLPLRVGDLPRDLGALSRLDREMMVGRVMPSTGVNSVRFGMRPCGRALAIASRVRIRGVIRQAWGLFVEPGSGLVIGGN